MINSINDWLQDHKSMIDLYTGMCDTAFSPLLNNLLQLATKNVADCFVSSYLDFWTVEARRKDSNELSQM